MNLGGAITLSPDPWMVARDRPPTWQLEQGRFIDQLRLTPPEDGVFGSNVAVQGDTYLISAPNEFSSAVRSGKDPGCIRH
ncbi:MAG: hypothetical protein WBG94_07385 [Anaerolineales bacterium]